MLRHVIAPARFFSQVPNDIIRHPRLSANAVRLLSWQLSLPDGADEPLSRTAERAGIRKTAFQHAKRELRHEGYLHEWREQTGLGRWRTTQLVSNVPLTAPDALRARAGGAVPATPTAAAPTVGEPTGRGVRRQPLERTGENTSHPPTVPATTEAEPEDSPPPASATQLDEAEELLRALSRRDPSLAMSCRKAQRWAPLVAPWLRLGLTREQVRSILTQGLDSARSPLGALRWRLEHALPDVRPLTLPAPAADPSPSRLTHMRECAGTHTQPRLFTPATDERLCAQCRDTQATAPGSSPPTGAGFLAFRAARTSTRAHRTEGYAA